MASWWPAAIVAFVTRDVLAIRALVAAGLAVTLTPRLIAGHLSGVHALALRDEPPRRVLYALTPERGPVAPPAIFSTRCAPFCNVARADHETTSDGGGTGRGLGYRLRSERVGLVDRLRVRSEPLPHRSGAPQEGHAPDS
jgi:hypothetical protein